MRRVIVICLMFCSLPAKAQEPGQGTLTRAWAAALLSGDDPRACPLVIGTGLAQRLSQYCLYWSGATHPTCAGDLDCNFIAHTIARECALPASPDPAASLKQEVVPCILDMRPDDWDNVRQISTEGPRIITPG